MKKLVLYIFLLSPFLINGQDSPEGIVNQFFNDYENQGADLALDNLYANNQWMLRASDAIANLKQQLGAMNEDYVGAYYGYELIVEKKLSNSLVLMSYLVKFDRQPLRFTFQFYKPDQEWRTYSFRFDADLDEEIEEAAKLYYLDLSK